MYPFIVTTISVRGNSQLDPPLHSWNFLIPIFLSCCVVYFLHFVLFTATRCNYYFTHRKLLSHSAGHCDQNNNSSPVFVVFDSELKALSTRVTYLSIAHCKLNLCILTNDTDKEQYCGRHNKQPRPPCPSISSRQEHCNWS